MPKKRQRRSRNIYFDFAKKSDYIYNRLRELGIHMIIIGYAKSLLYYKKTYRLLFANPHMTHQQFLKISGFNVIYKQIKKYAIKA